MKDKAADKDPAKEFARELLSALAVDGGSVQRIVNIGSRMLQNPIVLTDKSWKAVAMSPDIEIPEDDDWNALRNNGMLPPDAVASGIRGNLADRIEQSARPFKWQGAGMAHPRVFMALRAGGKTIVTLSVLEYIRPFSEADEANLDMLCSAVSAELQKNQFQLYSRGMLYEEFIWDLLEGRLTDPKAVDERVKLLGLGLKRNIYVFVFDVREYDAGQYSVAYMRDLLEQMLSGGRAIVYNDHIVITSSFTRAQDILKTELHNLGVFLKKYNIRCGISRRCTEPARLRFFYEQALDAMRIGTHMDGGRYIYPYGAYAVYHPAEACSAFDGKNTFGIRKYCHPALEALIAHDREYQTHYLESLDAYLRAFKNVTNAAAALHLHRNTLVYHIKRIEEIMEVSLDNYDSVQQIEFTFRLLEYDKKIERREKWEEIPESEG